MPEIYTAPKTHEPKHESQPEVQRHVKHPPSKPQLFSMFMVRPQGIKFETQEDDEDVLLLARQHLITAVGWMFGAFVLFLAPVFLSPFLLGAGFFPNTIPSGYYLLAPLIWYLLTLGFVLVNLLHWYFNVYIITNERVIDIDWMNLLYKQFSSTQLDKIQDVTYKQGGILDSFFDFGDVIIQTAGSEPNFEFLAVPKPDQFVREINQIVETYSQTKT